MRVFFLQTCRNRRGFTLVEMMVAITIGLIIMVAVTGVFISHSRTYTVNDDVSALQQTMRSVMMVMPPEMRLAGCDPTGTAGAGILTAKEKEFEFTADFAGAHGYPNQADGEFKADGERVAYKFVKGKNCAESANVPGGTLCRRGQGQGYGFQPIADNIEELEFNYILENGNSTLEPRASQRKNIRAVQVSLLARSAFKDPAFRDATATYTSASGQKWEPAKDDPDEESHHRRRLLITTIQLRNMGYTK